MHIFCGVTLIFCILITSYGLFRNRGNVKLRCTETLYFLTIVWITAAVCIRGSIYLKSDIFYYGYWYVIDEDSVNFCIQMFTCYMCTWENVLTVDELIECRYNPDLSAVNAAAVNYQPELNQS